MPRSMFNEVMPTGISALMAEWTKNHRGIPTAEVTKALYGTQINGTQNGTQNGAEHLTPAAWESTYQLEGIALPQVDDVYNSNNISNAQTFEWRRSVRAYDERPYTTHDLARLFALAYVSQRDSADAPYRGLETARYDIFLNKIAFLALNVEGLEKGAYLYNEHSHSVHPLRVEDPMPLIKSTCFQAEFTKAPLILLISTSIPYLLNLYGDRGYRYALVETGLIFQRLYLTTAYLAQSGSVSGSFTFRDIELWCGFDGYHRALVSTFVVGQRPQFQYQSFSV